MSAEWTAKHVRGQQSDSEFKCHRIRRAIGWLYIRGDDEERDIDGAPRDSPRSPEIVRRPEASDHRAGEEGNEQRHPLLVRRGHKDILRDHG